jgi:hypothetical protein
MASQCSTCFFVRLNSGIYTCHFNAPFANLGAIPQYSPPTAWPLVLAADWCGEFSITGPSPAWVAYTPVAVSEAGLITSYTAKGASVRINNTVTFRAEVLLNDIGTASGYMNISGPTAFAAAGSATPLTALMFAPAAVDNETLVAWIAAGGGCYVQAEPGATMWVNGYFIEVSGTYEAS